VSEEQVREPLDEQLDERRDVPGGSARPAGLDEHEARRRLRVDGPNVLPPRPPVPLGRRVLTALRDPLVVVLLAAMVLTVLSRDLGDTVIIALVVIVNTTLAVRQEVRAERDAQALAELVPQTSRVVRGGRPADVPSRDLVRGDLVVLRAGDMVPADCGLVESVDLTVDESALTGESMPVDKAAGGEPGAALLWSGTAVLHGRGRAVVTRTGAESTLGRIAGLLTESATSTPLQHRMSQLSVGLAGGVTVLCVVVLALGLLRGQPWETMLLTAVSLAVAAVPESLPAVVAITLALAARRMAGRHAVVRRLGAVETLGSVTLLATDKTGTLTEGVMRVADTWSAPGRDLRELWEAVVLCNDAEPAAARPSAVGDQVLGPLPGHGDPMELALFDAAAHAKVDVLALRGQWLRTDEQAFDRSRRSMTVTCSREGTTWTIRKGAPEAVLHGLDLEDSSSVVSEADRQAARFAADGARVIAVVARRRRAGADGPERWHLLGLVALRDPARTSARATVAACHQAGMSMVLVTGDHPGTADAIARQVGIRTGGGGSAVTATDALADPVVQPVVARAAPEDKLALVRHWQQLGHVVAMTGDGVNDGPALHQADVGVAMGRRGTEVARQSADLILADDELGTIVAAVEEGRRVYANIRRFLLYGLSGGAAEILAMLVGPFLGLPVPLLAGQLLWVNIVTHSFAGTALGVEPSEGGTMDRPPRSPEQAVLGGGLWWRLGLVSVVLTAAGIAAAVLAGPAESQTALMLTLGAGQLGVAWGVRARRGASTTQRGRPVLPLALGAAAALLALGALWPLLRTLLMTAPVGGGVWLAGAVAFLVMAGVTRAIRPHAF
jgi:Ca2+-transporting ATPase